MQRKNSPNKQGTRGSRRTPPRPAKQTASSSRMGYAPVAMSRAVVSQRIPQITSNGNTTRISHSEFFSSVVSTTTNYTVYSYPCNPGVASMFPWLSQVASRYETYKFRRIEFLYHTRAATTQVGTVGLVFDFDAEDPAPASQMGALSYHDKVADSPWKDSSLVLDLAQGDRLPTRYTRVGTPSGTYDIKTYDVGDLHIFVDGVAVSTNVGLIEVKYVIDLYTPQIQSPVGGSFAATAGLDATHLYGTNWTPDPDALAMFSTPTSQILTFNQAWEGICYFTIIGTGLAADYAPVPYRGDATILSQMVNAGATQVRGCMRIRAQPGTLFTSTLTATTVTSCTYVYATCSYDACA